MSQEQPPEIPAGKKKTEESEAFWFDSEGSIIDQALLRSRIAFLIAAAQGGGKFEGERGRAWKWSPPPSLSSILSTKTEVPKIEEEVSEKVSVNEEVIAKLTREIGELNKKAEIFESQRKKGEQSLRDIARKLNMAT